MTNSNKKPTNFNGDSTKKDSTIQFYNTEGVKKVFDIHRYSDKGTLYFKRKNEIAVV